MDTILVPTDFSNSSASTIRFAVDLANKMMAKLRFVYVQGEEQAERTELPSPKAAPLGKQIEVARYLSHMKDYVEQVLRDAGNVVTTSYTYALLKGSTAYEAVLDYVEEHVDVKYIVMGSHHGATGERNLMLGKDTNQLIAKSRIPVIAVSE
ncbi:universal stress protein [Olivibacter sitiensis]|uniref:universal stress protein n=1 Tax=Olivibacter sitiensis TaxID=376470 RepID=UPI000401B0D5|nr:universal stress protein [Olivibacter sitiensis]